MKHVLWLVEMRNRADQRDDEVWKVRASSSARALVLAQATARDSRFDTGRVVPARGGSSRARELAKQLRAYCTRTL